MIEQVVKVWAGLAGGGIADLRGGQHRNHGRYLNDAAVARGLTTVGSTWSVWSRRKR